MCQKGNCPFSNLKYKIKLKTFSKRLQKLKQESAEIETGMAEKSRWDQANRTAKTWFGLEK
jgi:hypothetical protein